MNYNYQDAKMESQQEYLGTAHINNTNEEMAQQFADNLDGYELTCNLLLAKDKNQVYKIGRYDGFLAGLKAGRSKWHILAEEPNILPKEGQKVRVLTEEGTIEESTLFYDTYYEELAWSNIGLIKVFAWCEMPKYEEANE